MSSYLHHLSAVKSIEEYLVEMSGGDEDYTV